MPKNNYVCDCNICHKDIVEDTMEKIIDTFTIQKVADFYKIIADPTRCKIISALMINPMCVCDLCNIMSMSKSSISHQLTKMRDAKILKCVRQGKEVIYSLEDDHIKEIFATTVRHLQHENK